MVVEEMEKKAHGIYLDAGTNDLINRFSEQNQLSRSASVRLIIIKAIGGNEPIERKQ